MRGSLLGLIGLLILGTCIWASAATVETVGERPNLLYNAGFERIREERLDGWFGTGANASAEARRSGQSGATLDPGARISALGIAAVPTLKYDVGGWFLASVDGECGMCVDFYGLGNRLIKSVNMPMEEGGAGEWTHIAARVEVPFGAGGFSVSVYNNTTADVFADDVWCTEVYQARVKRTSAPPAIDGVLDDLCWANASVGDEPWMTITGSVAKQQTRVFACYDDDHLYIAFRLYTRSPDALKTEETRDDFYVWRDDSAEVFIDANHDHRTYCELEVNASNVEYDAWCFDKNWECIWEHAVGTEADAWTCEMAIALASFEYRDHAGNPTGRMMLPRADVWGINFSRNDYVSGESSSWPNTGRSFHNAPVYGHLLRLEPLRAEAYREDATATIAAFRETLARYEMAVNEVAGDKTDTVAVADRTSSTHPLLSKLKAELDEMEIRTRTADDYDSWIQIGQSLSALGAGVGVLGEMAQPGLARIEWQEKTGERVSIGASVSTEPALEDGPPVAWATDESLALAIGRDDVTGFCVSIDAYEDTAGIQAEVLAPGLSIDRAAIISAPGCEKWGAAQWPPPSIKLAGGSRALLWVPIRSEAATRPGIYQGTLRITSEGNPSLVEPFEVEVLDICVPRTEEFALSALQPSFSALDITSELAGFGIENGSAAVSHVPDPADGEQYSGDEIERIAADTSARWRQSRIARPEMRRYVLGARGIAGVNIESIGKLYDALDDAIDDVQIMQLIAEETDVDAIASLEHEVDIWATTADLWAAVKAVVDDDAECWLYCEFPGSLHARGFGEARIQPVLARHLGAHGIVWGIEPVQRTGEQGENEDELSMPRISFPVYEMCCRMIAIGHRDCDYFGYIYDELLKERLSSKGGHHWRLAAKARMAARIYPTLIVAPDWYTTDYPTLVAHRNASQTSVQRIERHLLPLVRE